MFLTSEQDKISRKSKAEWGLSLAEHGIVDDLQ
jgi:hypothetical protein